MPETLAPEPVAPDVRSMRRRALPLLLLAAASADAAWAQTPRGPDARRAELDRAFAALRDAPDAAGAALVESRIRALWAQAASPAVLLLLRRGLRNLEAEQPAEAVEDLDAALVLGPDNADAWHLRAQAHARAGDRAAAAADLREALRLEPRHWAVLLTLATLQEERGDAAGALRSVDAALAIHPKLAGGEERRRGLRRKAEGDAL